MLEQSFVLRIVDACEGHVIGGGEARLVDLQGVLKCTHALEDVLASVVYSRHRD
jgi:hypothetical protein